MCCLMLPSVLLNCEVQRWLFSLGVPAEHLVTQVWGCFGGVKHCPQITAALNTLKAAEEAQKEKLVKLEAARAESDAKADLIANPPLSHQVFACCWVLFSLVAGAAGAACCCRRLLLLLLIAEYGAYVVR